MELTPEIQSMFLDPIAIAIVVGSFFGWILSVGLAMKWAFGLTSNETPSLRRATFIAFFMAFAQIFAAMFVAILVPREYQLIGNIGLILLNLKILGTFGGFGILRAVVANFLYGVFALLLFFFLAMGAGFAFYKGVVQRHPVAIDQLAAIAEAQKAEFAAVKNGRPQNPEGTSLDPDGSAGFHSMEDIRNVFFAAADEETNQSDAGGGDASTFGSWFGQGNLSVSPTSITEQTPEFHPGKNLDNGMPFQVQPVFDTSNQKGNPFVK